MYVVEIVGDALMTRGQHAVGQVGLCDNIAPLLGALCDAGYRVTITSISRVATPSEEQRTAFREITERVMKGAS